MIHVAGMFLAAQLASAGAVSAEEDERRIEALIAAERTSQAASVPPPVAAPSAAPTVVAPAVQADAGKAVPAEATGKAAAGPVSPPAASATVASAKHDVPPPTLAAPMTVVAPQTVSATPASPLELRASATPVKPAESENDADALRFDDLRKHVGETLRITMATGSRHTARVESADARQVIVRVAQAGGTATLTLQRAQITGIELP